MIRSVLLVMSLLALRGWGGAPVETREKNPSLFLCPGQPAVCSWSSDKAWRVVWRAREGINRDRLTLMPVEGGGHILWQRSPYGAALIVFSEGGQAIVSMNQGAPLKPASAVGRGPDGAVILCTAVRLDKTSCSTWILARHELTQGTLPELPENCLFPRQAGQSLFCVVDVNPFRDPALPLRISVWERSQERELELPAGFLLDFLPLAANRALFAYEDGKVFDVRDWRDIRGPVATGAYRLEKIRGQVYIFTRRDSGAGGSILHIVGDGVETLWSGDGFPQEMEALSDRELLVRLENSVGLSRLLLLQEGSDGKVGTKLIWEETVREPATPPVPGR